MNITVGENKEVSRSILLKTDTLGRVSMPRVKREALLDGFEQSGMSGQAFAKWAGINYQTFASWRQKRAKERGTTGQAGVIEWVEAQVEPAETEASPSSCLNIHLSAGARMEVSKMEQVSLAVAVINALECRC